MFLLQLSAAPPALFATRGDLCVRLRFARQSCRTESCLDRLEAIVIHPPAMKIGKQKDTLATGETRAVLTSSYASWRALPKHDAQAPILSQSFQTSTATICD